MLTTQLSNNNSKSLLSSAISSALHNQVPVKPNRVYASDAYGNHPSSRQTRLGLKEVYAPMGSGKTHLICELTVDARKQNMKILIGSPYRSSRLDFEDRLGTKYQPHKGLDSEYLYLMDILKSFLSHARYDQMSELPSTKERDDLINKWLDDYPSINNSLVILDELDFAWTQAKRTFVHTRKCIYKGATGIWESILRHLSKRCYCIGFSATYAPQLHTHGSTVTLDKAETSVRIPKIHTKLYGSNITTKTLMSNLLEDTLQYDPKPTLVFKSLYSTGDVTAVRAFANKHKKRVLVIQREENVPKIKHRNDWAKPILNTGFTNIRDEHADLEASYTHFLLVGADDDTPDTCADGYAATKTYDYVFVSTSSSRQYSLKEHSGYATNECRVICIGSKLTATMLQVAGRFRENPVSLELHLIKKTSDLVDEYSGSKGMAIASGYDPFFGTGHYGLEPDNVTAEWIGDVGARVGKAKGKAVSKATLDKQLVLGHFFEDRVLTNQKQDFNAYRSFVAAMNKSSGSNTKAYGERTFLNHWRAQKKEAVQ